MILLLFYLISNIIFPGRIRTIFEILFHETILSQPFIKYSFYQKHTTKFFPYHIIIPSNKLWGPEAQKKIHFNFSAGLELEMDGVCKMIPFSLF